MRPIPGVQIEDQPEPVLVRMTLWAEARGERDADRDLDARGMWAVACVLYNRERLWKQGLRQVILGRRQFSSFNPGDPNRAKLLTAWKDDPVNWERADAVADALEALKAEGLKCDITRGALNYYNPSVAQPTWGRGSPGWIETAVICNHAFGIAGVGH